MSKEVFESEKLFVVKPSSVIDEFRAYGTGRRIGCQRTIHCLSFIQNPKDITIAYENEGIYQDLFSLQIFKQEIDFHFDETTKFINVDHNDKILLTEYLCENIIWFIDNYKIVELAFLLQPFYTIEEIKFILKRIKSKIPVNTIKPKTFSLTKKISPPIFGKEKVDYEIIRDSK